MTCPDCLNDYHTKMNREIHKFLKDNWPGGVPNECPSCGLKKKLELRNIRPVINPGTYNQNFENWYFICRQCFNKKNIEKEYRNPNHDCICQECTDRYQRYDKTGIMGRRADFLSGGSK